MYRHRVCNALLVGKSRKKRKKLYCPDVHIELGNPTYEHHARVDEDHRLKPRLGPEGTAGVVVPLLGTVGTTSWPFENCWEVGWFTTPACGAAPAGWPLTCGSCGRGRVMYCFSTFSAAWSRMESASCKIQSEGEGVS